MSVVIRVENLSKQYRLGVVNRRMLYEELQSRYARLLGRPDPHATIGEDARSPGGGDADHIWALRDVSFDIRDGDVVGIIGRNGSGKSTLLKILSHITAPTSGRVLIKGRIASLLEVGTGFHPELTGRDNVYLNGAILGMTRAEINRRFDEIVDFSGVEKFLDTPVKRYSSGMRVRLAFAVAAHLDPEILIIDEVLAVGDASFQQKCLGKMSTAAREGRTILFVSHQAAAVENLCRRGIVLDRGQVRFAGTQTNAIAYYAESFAEQTGCLRDRTDRYGRGPIKVVAIEMRDEAGRTITTAPAGRDLEIWFFFENQAPDVPRPHLFLSLFVKTQFEVPVFMQSNLFTGDSFGADLPATGVFVCRLRNLPLPSASYRLGYQMSSQPLGGQWLDGLDAALNLHVEGGDYYGTGQSAPIHQGVCLVPGEWRLETAAFSQRNPST